MKDFSKLGALLTKEETKKIKGGRNCPVCDENPCTCDGYGSPCGTCGSTCVYFECKTKLGAYKSGIACSCGEAMLKCDDDDGVYCQDM